jgi:hypothetical protein
VTPTFHPPLRTCAATLALAVAFMSAAPTLAFCQATCLPAAAPAHHQAASAHHHLSHAAVHSSDFLLKDNAACKSEVQAALRRKQDSRTVERHAGKVAIVKVQVLSSRISTSHSGSSVLDQHGPPAFSPPLVRLRV